MANAPDSAASEIDGRDFDVGSLIRTASWGVGAAGALFLAVLAGISDSAAPRMAVVVSTLTGQVDKTAAAPARAPASAPVVAAQPQPQIQIQQQVTQETRRLNEQVRLLAADRDRLAQRIGVLERNLEDVTGSIRRQEASIKTTPSTEQSALPAPAAEIAMPVAPWPAIAPERTITTRWTDPPPAQTVPDVTAALPPATPLPLPRPGLPEVPNVAPAAQAPTAKPASPRQANQTAGRTEAPATRTAYGVDLGGAVSVDRLRMLWQALRTNEARLLQGLHPIAHTRGTNRGGRPDVRLIAGPLPNADEAAKLCAAILNAGRYCEPAVYHGQRLTSR